MSTKYATGKGTYQGRRLPGVYAMEAKRFYEDTNAPAKARTDVFYNPVLSRGGVRKVPPKPQLQDSLEQSRLNLSRSRDANSMERRHRSELDANPRAFFKRKGALESYVEHASSHSDMLVWQAAQNRDTDTESVLNRLKTSPHTDFYDIPDDNMANTAQRFAQSPLMTHRHKQAYAKRVRSQIRGVDSSSMSSYDGSSIASLDPLDAYKQGARDRHDVRPASAYVLTKADKNFPAHNKLLLKFERDHFTAQNFQDWTKTEIAEMLDQEGIEQPGKKYWDAAAGEMKRQPCNKQTYVEYCRRQLFDREQTPMLRRCRRLRGNKTYCIISLYKAARGGVRVVAYDQKACEEYQLVLIPTRLLDLDISPPPTSDDEQEWAEWSEFIIPRLVLENDGFLKVGTPPLLKNGLPAHFSLAGSPGAQKKKKAPRFDGEGGEAEVPLAVPSRMHVTLFFNHM